MNEFSTWKCAMLRPFIITHNLVQPTLSNEPVLTQSLTSKILGKDENGEGFSVLMLVSSQMLHVLLCILNWYGHYPDQTTPPLNSENGFCCLLNLGLSCKTISTLHKIFLKIFWIWQMESNFFFLNELSEFLFWGHSKRNLSCLWLIWISHGIFWELLYNLEKNVSHILHERNRLRLSACS